MYSMYRYLYEQYESRLSMDKVSDREIETTLLKVVYDGDTYTTDDRNNYDRGVSLLELLPYRARDVENTGKFFAHPGGIAKVRLRILGALENLIRESQVVRDYYLDNHYTDLVRTTQKTRDRLDRATRKKSKAIQLYKRVVSTIRVMPNRAYAVLVAVLTVAGTLVGILKNLGILGRK